MTKNQQLLLGVGVVGVAGYFYWKSKQPKVGFVNAAGKMKMAGMVKNYEGASKLASKREKTGTKDGKIFKKGFADQNVAPQKDAKWGNTTGFFAVKPGAYSWK